MRGESHRCLGLYLARRYMSHIPQRYVQAFLFGCIQPDRNPTTYLKGSLRCQWLRGHNYRNAERFMRRVSRRLEKKTSLNLFDCYTLGKLIHYTADAFTYAHNADFPGQLRSHRQYEILLQNYFLDFMAQDPTSNPTFHRSIMHTICGYHRHYEQIAPAFRKDSHFALTACCSVMTILFTKSIL